LRALLPRSGSALSIRLWLNRPRVAIERRSHRRAERARPQCPQPSGIGDGPSLCPLRGWPALRVEPRPFQGAGRDDPHPLYSDSPVSARIAAERKTGLRAITFNRNRVLVCRRLSLQLEWLKEWHRRLRRAGMVLGVIQR
jgi:hypothetical protein